MKKIKLVTLLLFISNLIFAQCWLQVDASGSHNLGVKLDGTLWVWGYNYYGELGDGTTVNKYSPTQLGTATDWVQVAAGFNFSLAIKSNGTLWAWGNNTYGQLGDGTTTNRLTPVQVGSATNWTKIVAGGANCLAQKNDGSLWGWGENGSGVLGIGNNTNKSIPTRVGTDTDWVIINTKQGSSAGIKSDGTLWTWGYNNYGQLGDGTTVSKNVPTLIQPTSTWIAVTFGQYFMHAIRSDGTLWAVGSNLYGALGIGLANQPSSINLLQVGTDTDWQKVYGGGYLYAKAIKTDGSLWGWGGNGGRVLGNITTTLVYAPVLISNESWSYVAAADQHTLNVKNDGTLWVCGQNIDGQLGTGSTTGNGLTYLTQINCPAGLGVTQNSISKFTLFPNPATNFVSITGEGVDDIDSIEIFDVSGKRIITTTSATINVEHLSNGMYLMQVKTNTKVERYKFIKQ